MSAYKKHQVKLLEKAVKLYKERGAPLSDAAKNAFLATPRHIFAKRFYDHGTGEWVDLNQDNLEIHLPSIYSDNPITLQKEESALPPSTISQPSFVLHMLDLLEIKPGQSIFELGAGSGWNAALIARLVGPSGRVVSAEIITDIADRAEMSLQELGIDNVEIIKGDGGSGWAAGAPYDRLIFTAGSFNLPAPYFEQVKAGGRILFILKIPGGGDILHILEKKEGYFTSSHALACGFVPMTGETANDRFAPIDIESMPDWEWYKARQGKSNRLWLDMGDEQGFRAMWRSRSPRFFLSLTEPDFTLFHNPREAQDKKMESVTFGLWDQAQRSLAMVKERTLLSYGDNSAKTRILNRINAWVALGMPPPEVFDLSIYPADTRLLADEDEGWIIKRGSCLLHFKLPL